MPIAIVDKKTFILRESGLFVYETNQYNEPGPEVLLSEVNIGDHFVINGRTVIHRLLEKISRVADFVWPTVYLIEYPHNIDIKETVGAPGYEKRQVMEEIYHMLQVKDDKGESWLTQQFPKVKKESTSAGATTEISLSDAFIVTKNGRLFYLDPSQQDDSILQEVDKNVDGIRGFKTHFHPGEASEEALHYFYESYDPFKKIIERLNNTRKTLLERENEGYCAITKEIIRLSPQARLFECDAQGKSIFEVARAKKLNSIVIQLSAKCENKLYELTYDSADLTNYENMRADGIKKNKTEQGTLKSKIEAKDRELSLAKRDDKKGNEYIIRLREQLQALKSSLEKLEFESEELLALPLVKKEMIESAKFHKQVLALPLKEKDGLLLKFAKLAQKATKTLIPGLQKEGRGEEAKLLEAFVENFPKFVIGQYYKYQTTYNFVGGDFDNIGFYQALLWYVTIEIPPGFRPEQMRTVRFWQTKPFDLYEFHAKIVSALIELKGFGELQKRRDPEDLANDNSPSSSSS